MKKIFLLLLLLISLYFSNILSEPTENPEPKKKRKKKKKKTLPNGLPLPDEVRPYTVSKELFCDACQALVSEALKSLRISTKESDVFYYLSQNVCGQDKYNIYHHPPPDMAMGCQAFYAAYAEEVENALTKRNKNDSAQEVIQKLCFERTTVCEGVDFNKMDRMDDSIMVDGKPVKINRGESIPDKETKSDNDKDNSKKDEVKVEGGDKKEEKKTDL